jgi:hypothetical protein
MDSFVRVGVFSNFGMAPGSAGGLKIRTVALPVVVVLPSFAPLSPRPLFSLREPPLEPKISAP